MDTLCRKLLFGAISCNIAHVAYGSLELISKEIVSCSNSNVCVDGKNLRIVLKASALETTAGEGSIIGTITGGQSWNDSYGEWTLLHPINIELDYQNAVWEHQLEEIKQFYLKT